MEDNKKYLVIVESPNKVNFSNAKLSVRRFNSMDEIKDVLLNLGIFIDNESFNSYVKLISDNRTTKQEKHKTERHHIVPRAYFKKLGYSDYSSWRVRSDVNINNIVNLLYKDHILAHYYLCLCIKDEQLKYKMVVAFLQMTNCNKCKISFEELLGIQKLDNFETLFDDFRRITGDTNRNRVLSEETKRKIGEANKGKNISPKSESHKQALKLARDLHSTTKGRKSIYNKEQNRVKYVNENELDFYINSGWILGGKPMSDITKQKIGSKNSVTLKGKCHQQKKDGAIYSGLEGNMVMCIETGVVFENVKKATEWLLRTKGIKGKIKDCCSGIRETTGGYHWKFILEDSVGGGLSQ